MKGKQTGRQAGRQAGRQHTAMLYYTGMQLHTRLQGHHTDKLTVTPKKILYNTRGSCLPVSSCSSCMGAILVEMTPLDPCRLKPSLEPDPLLCRRGPSTQEPCLRGSLPSPPAIDTRLDPCPCPTLRASSTACVK